MILICAGSVYSAEPKEYILTAYDAYVPPSGKDDAIKNVLLRGKLEKKGVLNFNPDIKGEALTFYIDGKLIGKGKTDKEGFAEIEYQPKERKNHTLTVKLEGSERYHPKEDSSLIYMIDPKKPTIIVDIDWTVSDTDRSSFLFGISDDGSKPLDKSPEVLTELNGYYNIIFLTGREDSYLKKTRAWMKKWGFPALPIFYADFGQTPYLAQVKYKKQAVARIKNDISNTIAGIGDRDYDATAYIKSGLKAFIIKSKDDLPKGTIVVDNWFEIREELLKDEYLNAK